MRKEYDLGENSGYLASITFLGLLYGVKKVITGEISSYEDLKEEYSELYERSSETLDSLEELSNQPIQRENMNWEEVRSELDENSRD